jgi:hypothetical protein
VYGHQVPRHEIGFRGRRYLVSCFDEPCRRYGKQCRHCRLGLRPACDRTRPYSLSEPVLELVELEDTSGKLQVGLEQVQAVHTLDMESTGMGDVSRHSTIVD